VHRLLTNADPVEGVSKEALAISLDEKEQQVYSSLRQLSKEGRAETRYVKGHGYRWFAVSPAETA
jgi:DNA-binding PadR family transcriptional regulator